MFKFGDNKYVVLDVRELGKYANAMKPTPPEDLCDLENSWPFLLRIRNYIDANKRLPNAYVFDGKIHTQEMYWSPIEWTNRINWQDIFMAIGEFSTLLDDSIWRFVFCDGDTKLVIIIFWTDEGYGDVATHIKIYHVDTWNKMMGVA